MSQRITWTDKIRTGNYYIDLQHQELIELINALASHIDSDQSLNEIQEALKQLNRYVIFHFNTEETLMANSRLSMEHVRHHIDAHKAFSTRVEFFQNAGVENIRSGELIDFLVSWLTEHIQKTDQELVHLLSA